MTVFYVISKSKGNKKQNGSDKMNTCCYLFKLLKLYATLSVNIRNFTRCLHCCT
jgi:cytosine/uracil/thiamine/allantoin permease